MKSPLQKSPIPISFALVANNLTASYSALNWHFHPVNQLFVALEGSETFFIGVHENGILLITNKGGVTLSHLLQYIRKSFQR